MCAWNDLEEDYSSEQDDDDVESSSVVSGDVDGNVRSDHHFDDIIVSVCEDASHRWIESFAARRLFRDNSKLDFLEAIIYTIAQCVEPESELSPNQIKMAATLARSLPLEKMTVRDDDCLFMLNQQSVLVLSEYLKGYSHLHLLFRPTVR